MVRGGERGWNEIGEGVEGNRNGGGMRQGKGMKGNRGGGEEESMNYPYIISTLFVLVWVDCGCFSGL